MFGIGYWRLDDWMGCRINLKLATRNPSQSQVGLADDFVLKEFISETLSNDLS